MIDVCPCLLGTTSDGESEDSDPCGVSSVTSSDDATETLDADLDANNGPSDIGEVLSFAGRNLDDASLVDFLSSTSLPATENVDRAVDAKYKAKLRKSEKKQAFGTDVSKLKAGISGSAGSGTKKSGWFEDLPAQ